MVMVMMFFYEYANQDEVGSSESGSPTSISAKANSMMVRTVAMDVLIHFERRTPSQPKRRQASATRQ